MTTYRRCESRLCGLELQLGSYLDKVSDTGVGVVSLGCVG